MLDALWLELSYFISWCKLIRLFNSELYICITVLMLPRLQRLIWSRCLIIIQLFEPPCHFYSSSFLIRPDLIRCNVYFYSPFNKYFPTQTSSISSEMAILNLIKQKADKRRNDSNIDWCISNSQKLSNLRENIGKQRTFPDRSGREKVIISIPPPG